LEDQVDVAAPFIPALHPGIAYTYAAKVEELREVLMKGQDPEALEAARALIDKVIIHAADEGGNSPGIELVGELMAMLEAAGVTCPRDAGDQAQCNVGLTEVLDAMTAQQGRWDPLARTNR
jgi:hypothetical protein